VRQGTKGGLCERIAVEMTSVARRKKDAAIRLGRGKKKKAHRRDTALKKGQKKEGFQDRGRPGGRKEKKKGHWE